MLNDRIVRLDTKSGMTVEYLLPRISANISACHAQADCPVVACVCTA